MIVQCVARGRSQPWSPPSGRASAHPTPTPVLPRSEAMSNLDSSTRRSDGRATSRREFLKQGGSIVAGGLDPRPRGLRRR